MMKLRYSALAIFVALAAIACGNDTGGSAADATDNTANAADTAAAAPDTTADSATPQSTPASSAESVTDVPHLTGEQIAELIDDPDIFLLDVRNADELPEQGAIEGYTLIPIDELADRLDELPRDKTILTI